MKRKTAGILALLFAITMAVTGCSGSNTVDSTAEAVSVDGVSIPLGEVNFYLRYQQTQIQSLYSSLFGDDFLNQDLMGTGSVYGETVRDTVLEALEEYYIVEANAEDLGVTLSDEEETAIGEAVTAFLAANDSETLEKLSADEATVTHFLQLVTIQNKVYEALAATIDTEVSEEESVQKRISYVFSSTAGTTDDDGNTVELTDEELDELKTELEEILAEAEESGDLSTAAEDHDLSAVSITYGVDDTSLDESVYEAAESLDEGEYSDVIETEDGYYIIYMESLYDEDATQTEIESILSEREQEAYSSWLEPLQEAAEIVVNEENVATLTFERIFEAATEETEEEDTAEE